MLDIFLEFEKVKCLLVVGPHAGLPLNQCPIINGRGSLL